MVVFITHSTPSAISLDDRRYRIVTLSKAWLNNTKHTFEVLPVLNWLCLNLQVVLQVISQIVSSDGTISEHTIQKWARNVASLSVPLSKLSH